MSVQPYKAPATGRRAAVIGGGAQGLSAAYFLARLGHSPTIFEGLPELGGLLRKAIPESRLPRDVLDFEIQEILDLGVEAHTNLAFGRDFSLSWLWEQGYEVVLTAMGGWDTLLIRGQEGASAPGLPGIHMLLPLNLAWASGREVDLGAKVVLVGCGREIFNAARRCLKKGLDQVTILCNQPPDRSGIPAEELARAAEEGITVIPQARVVQLKGIGDRLTELVFIQGRQSERSIEADTVISASGRLPEVIMVREPDPEQEEETVAVSGTEVGWRMLMPYHRPSDRPYDLFYSSEPVSDYWAVVEAIGAGRRAAASMHKIFSGEDPSEPADMIAPGETLYQVDQLQNLIEAGPRATMPEADPEERLDPAREVALGLDRQAAQAEASRCLNCGLICYYRSKYH